MAFDYIYFNQNTQHGRMLREALRLSEDSDRQLAAVRDVMIKMRSGDGSQDAHYDEVARRFGFGDYDVTTPGTPPSALALSKARESFLEIDSAYSKISGNGSVSDVRAARDQVVAKHRQG